MAAHDEMSKAIQKSRHESYTAEEQDHIAREHETSERLAKAYKQRQLGRS